ncbi:MAG: hypothetical protein ACUVYA_20555, partial [Planctomycetota bacterium]
AAAGAAGAGAAPEPEGEELPLDEILSDDILSEDVLSEQAEAAAAEPAETPAPPAESEAPTEAAGGAGGIDTLSEADLVEEEIPLLEDDTRAEEKAVPSAEAVPEETVPETEAPKAGAAEEPAAEPETAELPSSAPEEKAAEPKKKGLKGLKKLGKTKAPKAPRAPKAPKAPRAPKEEKPAPKAAGPAKMRGTITFICSECYEELVLPSQFSEELISCPECLHVGKRPDDDFLRTVRMHKAGERRSFVAAIAAGALLVVVLLALLYFRSPDYLATHGSPSEGLTYGLLGSAGVLGALLIWLTVRAEGNRWEVYF